MGVNLEWEVCESGRGAGEEWAGATTMPSSAELLLPAERGFLCSWQGWAGWEHPSGAGRVWKEKGNCWEQGLHPGTLAGAEPTLKGWLLKGDFPCCESQSKHSET